MQGEARPPPAHQGTGNIWLAERRDWAVTPEELLAVLLEIAPVMLGPRWGGGRAGAVRTPAGHSPICQGSMI